MIEGEFQVERRPCQQKVLPYSVWRSYAWAGLPRCSWAEDSKTVDPAYRHASAESVERWRDMKYGLRICWGQFSLWEIEASWPLREMSPAQKRDYFDLYKRFNPTNFDAEKWMDLLERGGLKYLTIPTKHHDGFSLYDTKTRVERRVDWTAPGGPKIESCDVAYSIMDGPFHRDIVKELCDAAHSRGIGIDLYFSHIDWYDADFRMEPFHPFYDKHFNGQTDPAGYARMVRRHREQIRELLTNYGKVDMMCLDMELPAFCWPEIKETIMMARRLQPDCLFRNRGIGAYGDYHTPENWVPHTEKSPASELPWMVIYNLAKLYAYDPEPANYKPGSWIVANLIDIVAKGGNFMVILGPDAKGNFHPKAVQALEYAGDWLKINGEAIYKTRIYKYYHEGERVRYTRSKDGKYVYAISLQWPGEQLKLRLVRPRAGSQITMLGAGEHLNWRRDKDGVLIDLPAELQNESRRPCKQAYVFKIERGEDVPESMGEIADAEDVAAAPAVKEADRVPDLKLDETETVVLEKARNGLPAKSKVVATPSFPNYRLAPIVDGIKLRKDMGWQESSWVSEEDASPHGIELRLSKPARGGRFQITWGYDINNDEGGRWWISRNYCIQIKNKAESPWKTVLSVKDNQSAIGSYPLPDEPFRFLRVVQLPGGGHKLRPNLMWVGQVELTD